MNRADATKALNDLTADFEKNAAALRAIIEAPEKPGRWEPEKGEIYWALASSGRVADFFWHLSDPVCQWHSLMGNVHRTEAEAETYKLWLESFVPVYGLTVPEPRVLDKGWCINVQGNKSEADSWTTHALEIAYLEGRWAPTEPEIDAKLERFGKVRGFTK